MPAGRETDLCDLPGGRVTRARGSYPPADCWSCIWRNPFVTRRPGWPYSQEYGREGVGCCEPGFVSQGLLFCLQGHGISSGSGQIGGLGAKRELGGFMGPGSEWQSHQGGTVGTRGTFQSSWNRQLLFLTNRYHTEPGLIMTTR